METMDSEEVRKRTPKQIAGLVILIAMAMVLSFVEFPLIPAFSWLKYDPSGIIALLSAFLYGPWVGSIVAVLAWIPHLVTDPLGAFMNILSSVSIVVVVGLLYRRKPTLVGAVQGVILGVICSLVVSIVLNFLVTPLYLVVTVEEVAALVLPALLPFNIAKLVINGLIALVAYRKLEALLAEEDDSSGEEAAPELLEPSKGGLKYRE